MEMSSRLTLILCLFFAMSQGIHAMDWAWFVENSDRSSDPAIIEALATNDLQAQRSIVSALAKRADPYAADIIEAILSGFGGKLVSRRELLLRLIVTSLFSPDESPAAVSRRIDANRDALDALVSGLNAYRDPQLAAAIVRIIPLLDESRYLPLVTQAASTLENRMADQQGGLSPMDADLLFTILAYAEAHPSFDLLEMCLAASRGSRNKRIVDESRAAARSIARLMK